MLVAQAKAAAELFCGHPLPEEQIDTITAALRAERSNCVLIAMPGAGKTTVGGKAATLLGKTFVDADDEIIKETGKTPAELITTQGEAAFRDIESRVIAELAKRGGMLPGVTAKTVTSKAPVLPKD